MPCQEDNHNNFLSVVIIVVVVCVCVGGGICVTTRAVMTCAYEKRMLSCGGWGVPVCVICHPSIDRGGNARLAIDPSQENNENFEPPANIGSMFCLVFIF